MPKLLILTLLSQAEAAAKKQRDNRKDFSLHTDDFFSEKNFFFTPASLFKH